MLRLAAPAVSAIIADCIDCGYIAPTESDRIRIAELARHAPTILHTARRFDERRHLAATRDVEAVVPKPTDFNILLALLE